MNKKPKVIRAWALVTRNGNFSWYSGNDAPMYEIFKSERGAKGRRCWDRECGSCLEIIEVTIKPSTRKRK